MKIGHIVNKIPLVKQNKETTELIDSATLLGVEVEVERYKAYDVNHIYSGYWTAKKDDSLRNNGMEMVFAEPLAGADAVSAIKWLCEQAVTHKWVVSKLTGLHVHVDIRNLELEQFKNFCAVYSLVEPLIYNWVGRNRFENMFCLPWYMAEVDLKAISKIAKEGEDDPARAREFLEGLSKYSGLNIHAVHKFGTAEFRMLETTFDVARILDWVNILLSLKKYAVSPGVTPQTMCEKLRQHGGWAFACNVFGINLVNKMWYPLYATESIGQGMVTCDWFLDNVKDMKLKGKPLGVQLDWARIAKLMGPSQESQLGEHPGHRKWQEAQSRKPQEVTDMAPKKKKLATMTSAEWVTSLYGQSAGILETVPTVETNTIWPSDVPPPSFSIEDDYEGP